MNPSYGMNRAQLSIVIPVFKFNAALPMIRAFVADISSIELLIGVIDSEPGDLVEIEKILDFKNLNRRLLLLQSSTPPATNWNQLLSVATGKYMVLFHHDEYPSCGYITELLSLFQRRPEIDVFIAPCILVNPDYTFKKTHSTFGVLSLFVRLDGYILRRNYIGPTACMTFRNDNRSKIMHFDPGLRWFVDCEFYQRQLNRHRDNILVVNHAGIRSIQRGVGTITVGLKSNLKNIKLDETAYMRGKYGDRLIWLKSASFFRNLGFGVEFILYGSIRFYLLILDLFKKL